MSDSTSPAVDLVTIVPSDSVHIKDATKTNVNIRLIYVGSAGDVAVKTNLGTIAVHKGVSQGQYIGPFIISYVMAAGTTASNMIGYV